MSRSILMMTVFFVASEWSLFAQAPSVNDFLPPVQGGPTEIAEPGEVEVNDDLVVAATAQDAMNAAVEANIETIKEEPRKASKSPEIGARWVKFGSGRGVLATGAGSYQEHPNPTAGLIAQRNAYVVAYTNAKAAMVKQVGELSSVGENIVNDIATQIVSSDATEQESNSVTEENIAQAGQAILKGYVTYSVQELESKQSPSTREVYVSIASSPKTLTAAQRSGAIQQAADLAAGIQNVLDELKQGIVPPVGGRVVTVPSSGKTAFIGFGSAIVTPARNPALAAKNKLTAQKIADARAYDALTGILAGDETVWRTGIKSKVDASFAETERYAMDNSEPDTAIATIEAARQAFTSERTHTETVQSIRRGILPPGIQRNGWIDDDGNWALTMVAYYPDMTAAVRKFAERMSSADLLRGSRESNSRRAAASGDTSGKRKVSTKVKPREGGKVSSDDDL